MAAKTGLSIGIDLGTTYSCVGCWQHNTVEIIANESGNRTTPSYVSIRGTERLVGTAAKNLVSINPEHTIFDAKRLIGRKFTDEHIQQDIKTWPFKVISGPMDKPLIEIEFNNEIRTFSPEEISSMILRKMKVISESDG